MLESKRFNFLNGDSKKTAKLKSRKKNLIMEFWYKKNTFKLKFKNILSFYFSPGQAKTFDCTGKDALIIADAFYGISNNGTCEYK